MNKNWQSKLIDFIEKEMQNCWWKADKNKRCYMNPILKEVERIIKAERQRIIKEIKGIRNIETEDREYQAVERLKRIIKKL